MEAGLFLAILLLAAPAQAQWDGCETNGEAVDPCVESRKALQELRQHEFGTPEERALVERKWEEQRKNAEAAAEWSRQHDPWTYYSKTCSLRFDVEGLGYRMRNGEERTDWMMQCIREHIAADQRKNVAHPTKRQPTRPLSEDERELGEWLATQGK